MIGMVTSCTGKQTLLPALLQWNIKRTDGEPCDSFSVQFLCGKTTKELLEQATEFRATEKGRVVFTGIVDDFELRLGKEGAIAELTGRGMAAKEAAGSSIRLGREILTAQYVRNRYGVAARQVLINTRNGSYQAADYAGFQALGGTRVQYAGRTGDKIRATFRTAKQRLDDTKRDEKLLYVTYPGSFLAEPLDQAVVSIGALGIRGTFTVQEAQSGCDETGATCTLILR